MSNKVLILTGDGGEVLEVMYPYERLREEGYEPVVASLSKKTLQFVVHDFVESFDTYTEKLGHTWPADISVSDVDPDEYAALVIPGGRAPEYLRLNDHVKRIVRSFFDENKPVAVTCHGAMVLGEAGVLGGRTCSAFPMVEPEVRRAGGNFEAGEAVIDGNLVSARAWNDNGPWMGAFIKKLAE